MVILGAELLVDGAVGLARVLGLSEAVIGLTVGPPVVCCVSRRDLAGSSRDDG